MSSSEVDARYRAKLAARESGSAKPVFMANPLESKSPQGSEVDARYHAKLAARAAAQAPEQKPSADDVELERMLAEEANSKPAPEQKPKR